MTGGRCPDTSLAEIHQEMSELFDKQAGRCSLKKILEFTQALKVCNHYDENERKKQRKKK